MTENSSPNVLEVVSFFADGHRFAVEAEQVRTQLQAEKYDTATSVEHILGLSCDNLQNPHSRRILVMKCHAQDYAVAVSEPVELRSLDIGAIYPLPLLIASRSTLRGIRGLVMESGEMTVLVDFRAFKQSESMSNS
jgi:chemotaxis signal transduction protein